MRFVQTYQGPLLALSSVAKATWAAACYDQQADAVLMKQLRGKVLEADVALRQSSLAVDQIPAIAHHALGFMPARVGSGFVIHLIPLPLAGLIRDDTQLYALTTGRTVKGSDIVYDTIINGCIPYGIAAK